MKVLTTESLEKLRWAVTKNPTLVETNFYELTDSLDLNMVEFNAKIEINGTLLMPEGITQNNNKDTENCMIISKVISGLNPSQATDERLWVTLCFDQFSDYTNSRWPLSRAKSIENHVADHWFSKTNRNRIRDNAVARLWWMSQIAKRVPDTSIEQVLEVLFFNSDYRSSLLERNSSANSLNVLASIIKISKESFDRGQAYDRESFRTFMKQVDFIGKRTVLASLEVETLLKILRPVYISSFSNSDE
jgi:hypothetical protein